MEKKYIIVFVLIIIGSAVSCVPAFGNVSLCRYIVGVIGFVIILMAIALFVNITAECKDEKFGADDEKHDKLSIMLQKINRSATTVFSAFNNVGCALFFCILLIVGIGAFDALMSRNKEPNEEKVKYTICHIHCRCMTVDTLKVPHSNRIK